MTNGYARGAPARRRTGSLDWTAFLPFVSFALLMVVIFVIQPRSFSYMGLRLLLNFSIPLIFASMAQSCIILMGDIDLGIGSFIALANCIAARWLEADPLLAVASFAGCLAAYGAMGALIQHRALPSIIVTLGASFVWLGLAVLVMPRPGGSAPAWLVGLVRGQPPIFPVPIIVSLAVGLLAHWVLNVSSLGAVLRGAGGSPATLARSGWSLLRLKVGLFVAGGFFALLAGVALTGLNTTGDANVGDQYTLLSIAAVVVGGGQFSGGVVSAFGSVIGALTMLLVSVLLSFLNISTDWQMSVQGAILVLVLAARAFSSREP